MYKKKNKVKNKQNFSKTQESKNNNLNNQIYFIINSQQNYLTKVVSKILKNQLKIIHS